MNEETAGGAPLERMVGPLGDYLQEQWGDPAKVPHLVRAVVRMEVEKTARTALKCTAAVLLAYIAGELLKMWAAA